LRVKAVAGPEPATPRFSRSGDKGAAMTLSVPPLPPATPGHRGPYAACGIGSTRQTCE
jgi:hypothetical protein